MIQDLPSVSEAERSFKQAVENLPSVIELKELLEPFRSYFKVHIGIGSVISMIDRLHPNPEITDRLTCDEARDVCFMFVDKIGWQFFEYAGCRFDQLTPKQMNSFYRLFDCCLKCEIFNLSAAREMTVSLGKLDNFIVMMGDKVSDVMGKMSRNHQEYEEFLNCFPLFKKPSSQEEPDSKEELESKKEDPDSREKEKPNSKEEEDLDSGFPSRS